MKSAKAVLARLSILLSLSSFSANIFCVLPKDLLKKATVKDIEKKNADSSIYYLFDKYSYFSCLFTTKYAIGIFCAARRIDEKLVYLDEKSPEAIIIKNLLIKCWKQDSGILFKEKKNHHCDLLIKTFSEKNS